jgi:HEPN domain-containing protein
MPWNDPDPLYMAGGNEDEAGRWFRQAECDLAAALVSLNGGSYEWTCFQAQQSAEKALKALLYAV